MKFVKLLVLAVFITLAWILIGNSTAEATESFCPGGSSPRSDIKKCFDYDVVTHCTTGWESACWTDNGFPSPFTTAVEEDNTIKTDGGVVGPGYLHCHPLAGAVGCFFGGLPNVFSPPVPEFAMRYYIRRKMFTAFQSGHNIQMQWLGTGGCTGSIKFQLSTYSGVLYYPAGGPVGACSITSYFLGPNVPNSTTPVPIKNDKWVSIEVYGKMDTVCTTFNEHGCNGIIKVWVDGTLVINYTDLNMNGTSNAAKWGLEWDVPEVYNHPGSPPWRPSIDYDQFVLSDCSNNACTGAGPYIGPAAGASVGTPVAASPYGGWLPYEPWLGHRAGGDCDSQAYLSGYQASQYGSGGTLDSTITHGKYTNQKCIFNIGPTPGTSPLASYFSNHWTGMIATVRDGVNSSDCTVGGGSVQHNCMWNGSAWVATTANDNSMKVTLTSTNSGGGIIHFSENANYIFPQQHSYGWIYLPSSNNYNYTNLALSGFKEQFGSAYVALGTFGCPAACRWAVVQASTSGVTGVIPGNPGMTFDAWVEYELSIWQDGTVSLMIGDGVTRTKVVNRQTPPQSIAWAFTNAADSNGDVNHVVGIINFQGTPNFVAYFDDHTVTTVSAWSCDGWGTDCPFGSDPTPPPCDYYASNNGTGNGLSISSPFTLSSFFSVAVGGKTVCLLDGTYQGANNMVSPGISVPGKSGSQGALIGVRALNDGQVTIDGQFTNAPLRFDGNSYWRVDGINFKSGVSDVAILQAGSNHNAIRRSIFWDAPLDENATVVDHNVADDNLWEDIAIFGAGRFSINNFNGNRNTVRRAWIRWEGSINVGPKRGLVMAYGGSPSSFFTCENCLVTWNAQSMPNTYTLYNNGTVWTGAGAGVYTGFTVQSAASPIGTEGNDNEVLNSLVAGSLSYIKTSEFIASAASPPVMVQFRFSDNQTLTNIFSIVPSDYPTASSLIGFDVGDPSVTTSGNSLSHSTSVQSFVDLGNDWPVSSFSFGTTLASVPSPWTATATTGANLCFQWVNGSVTTTPLWPWPMNDRIKAATAAAGAYTGPCTGCTGGRTARTQTDVTADIQALLGPIPQTCLSVVAPPAAPVNLHFIP